MTNFKRPAVVFNLDNPSHAELYYWCMEQSTNFSDFVRTVLFLYKQQRIATEQGDVGVQLKSSDAESMMELL